MSKVLIDFEEAFNSFTGIPLSVLNDTECILKSGQSVILWISDGSKLHQIRDWRENRFNEEENSRLNVCDTRPSNWKLWISQLLGLRIKIPSVDFVYLRLFPGLRFDLKSRIILRIDDPFGEGNSLRKELQANWKRPKILIARYLRTQAFLRMVDGLILVANSKYTLKKVATIHEVVTGNCVIYPPVQFDSVIYSQDWNLLPKRSVTKPFFLIIGGQRQRKDPTSIVNSWLNSNDMKAFSLKIVGKIPLQLLESKNREALDNGSLTFLTNVNSKELACLIAESSGIVFHSNGEGFGNPLAESLVLGRPVICNDLEVFQEVAGEFGFYYPTSKPEEAIKILANLVKREDFFEDKMVTERRNYAVKFTKQSATTEWIKVFSQIA